MKIRFCSLIAVALISSAAYGGNIVTNPSFESADLSGWTGGDWIVATSVNPSPAVDTILPEDGSYLAFTACNSGTSCITDSSNYLSQLVPATSGTYTLSFYYDLGDTQCADFDDCLGGPDNDSANTYAQLEVMWGSDVVLNVSANDQSDAGYQFFTVSGLTSNPSGELLAFAGEEDPDYLVVDNVSVTADSVGGGAVPEPAPLALLGCGLAGIAILRSRKRRAVRAEL